MRRDTKQHTNNPPLIGAVPKLSYSTLEPIGRNMRRQINPMAVSMGEHDKYIQH